MPIAVRQPLPEFTLRGVKGGFHDVEQGGESAFCKMSTASLHGHWKLIFFWPKNFSKICPMEIAELGRLYEEYQRRDCEIYGISMDSLESHLQWRRENADLYGSPFIWLSDEGGTVTDLFGVRDPEKGVAQRAMLLVDPHNVVWYLTINPMNVGRNPHEPLRVLDVLQTDPQCPCNIPVDSDRG